MCDPKPMKQYYAAAPFQRNCFRRVVNEQAHPFFLGALARDVKLVDDQSSYSGKR